MSTPTSPPAPTTSSSTAPNTLLSLPEKILCEIIYLALPYRDPDIFASLIVPTRMFKRSMAPCPPPSFLTVNKRIHDLGLVIWLNSGPCHIYLNSWDEVPSGLLTSLSKMTTLVAITLDIRNGRAETQEGKLRTSVFSEKLGMVLSSLKHVEMLLLRVWVGKHAAPIVVRGVVNAFFTTGLKVHDSVSVYSIVNSDGSRETLLPVCKPEALSPGYLRALVGHLLDQDPASLEGLKGRIMKRSRLRTVTAPSGTRFRGEDVKEQSVGTSEAVDAKGTETTADDANGTAGAADTDQVLVKSMGPLTIQS